MFRRAFTIRFQTLKHYCADPDIATSNDRFFLSYFYEFLISGDGLVKKVLSISLKMKGTKRWIEKKSNVRE